MTLDSLDAPHYIIRMFLGTKRDNVKEDRPM